MQDIEKLIGYLRGACEQLLNRETLDAAKSLAFRPTQRDAISAYAEFLDRGVLSTKEKLSGFFEIPTGVGKTAVFSAIIGEAVRLAQSDGQALRIGIVSPTTNLLTQTRDELLSINPDLADKVGLYGGNDRQLDMPITIITYDSWANLVDNGTLGGESFDILISDEAHRGTSAERERKLIEAFDNGVAKLAFTATAHFDLGKTVFNTHRNCIFERHIPESVLLGELAAYIHVQTYVMRMMVDEADKEKRFDAGAVKQMEFNRLVEKLLLEGLDQYSGKPLTDNQGGIFVYNTRQADDLTAALNANPELKSVAKASGCTDFAVAIHTNGISDAEQIRRERDYKAGKYLFVVGDEKFKEGFDHAPMKTVIDVPHGSAVDKAQILGRGARRYGNEGLTFIDVVLYFGDQDAELDAKARANAIKDAVLACDVLDGNIELSDPRVGNVVRKVANVPPRIFETVVVVSHETLEQVRILLAEREAVSQQYEEVIENWAESEQYRELRDLIAEKGGLGSKTLYQRARESAEYKYKFSSHGVIYSIIHGRTKSVPVVQYEALRDIVEAYEPVAAIANWPESEQYRELRDLIAAKGGIGRKALYQRAEESVEYKGKFSSDAVIDNIISGRINFVPVAQYEVLRDILEAYEPVATIADWPRSEQYLELRDMIEAKGGFGSKILYQRADESVEHKGKFSSHGVIQYIIYGKTKSVPVVQYEALRDIVEAYEPVAAIANWPESEQYQELRGLIAAKGGLGGKSLYRKAQESPKTQGKFLSHKVIENIIFGKTRSVAVEQYEALRGILEAYEPVAVIADWSESEWYIKLCDLIKAKGGIGARTLYQGAEKNAKTQGKFPSYKVIENIILGVLKSVPVAQYEALCDILHAIPDVDGPSRPRPRVGRAAATNECQ